MVKNLNGKNYRLRNHIPISGPATREPIVGDEADMRVSLGFTPKWYVDRVGIDFSEKWHLDPESRYDSLLKMKNYLHKTFPMVPYFKPILKQDVEQSCATISGVFGIMLVSSLYGLEIDYRKDNWPDAKKGQRIPVDELKKLKPFAIESHPVVVQLLEQMDFIDKKWGHIHGYLNYQGILNVAMKVRGPDIFMDMILDPGFAHFVLAHIAQTIGDISKLVQARQRESGFQVNLLSMSNCVMNMISPEQYEKFVLPLDKKLSYEYERFGIHTCNWDVTPYLHPLRKIEKMGYLDTGKMADLARIKQMFPDTRRAVMYSPVELENKSLVEIRKDILRIYQEYAPCDIVLADVESTVPDKRVTDFLDLVEDVMHRDGGEDGD